MKPLLEYNIQLEMRIQLFKKKKSTPKYSKKNLKERFILR